MRFVIALVLAVTFAITLHAQANLVGYVDIPSPGGAVQTGQFYAAGWAFDCATGDHPPHVTLALWNLDTGGWFASDYYLAPHLDRPDVLDVFKPYCPTLTAYVGYHLYLYRQPPPGRWRVWVAFASFDGTQMSEYRDITVTP